MNASWTIARLLREYPECKRRVHSWDLDTEELGALTIEAVAEELEEDLDDLLDELDRTINSSSAYETDDDEDEDDDDVLGSLTPEDNMVPDIDPDEEFEEQINEIDDLPQEDTGEVFEGEIDDEEEEQEEEEEEEEVEEED